MTPSTTATLRDLADRCEAAEGPSVSCPSCDGRGTTPAFVETTRGGHFDPALRCMTCKGAGTISAQERGWRVRGEVLSTARRDRGESVLQLARRIGWGPAEVGAAEHGRVDPAPLEAALRARVTP